MVSNFCKESSQVYPVPYTGKQPEDWDLEKIKHIKHWSNRFGLNDARPFKMVSGMIRIRVKWERIKDTLKVETVFSNQMVETARLIYTKDAIEKHIIDLIKNYHLVYPSAIEDLNNEFGEVCIFSPKLPEQDWKVWTRDIYKGTRHRLKRRCVNSTIERYRNDANFLTDLQSLRNYIYKNCKME